MSIKPTVSIILPTYNRPNLLTEAIESIISQSLKDWEIIVIDDGSNPRTDQFDIQKKYGSQISVIHHKNSLGGAAAKNTGARIAKGKYLAFLDDDDLYDSKYLENAIATLESNEQIKTLFMNVKWFGANEKWAQNDHDKAMMKTLARAKGSSANNPVIFFDRLPLFEALLNSVPMAFQRPVLRKQHFLEIGHYKADCLLWDCDWAIRASLRGNCALFNEGLYLQRCAGQGYSSTPKRLLDHQLSNFEFKIQLLTEVNDKNLAKLIKPAIIRAGQALSWGYMNEKHHLEAAKVLIKTFEYGFTYQQIKFLIHNLINYLKLVLKNADHN